LSNQRIFRERLIMGGLRHLPNVSFAVKAVILVTWITGIFCFVPKIR